MKRRVLFGWIAALLGLAFAAWRGALAIHWFREWRATVGFDPSGAELYELNFWLEAAFTFTALVIGILGMLLARRDQGRSA